MFKTTPSSPPFPPTPTAQVPGRHATAALATPEAQTVRENPQLRGSLQLPDKPILAVR